MGHKTHEYHLQPYEYRQNRRKDPVPLLEVVHLDTPRFLAVFVIASNGWMYENPQSMNEYQSRKLPHLTEWLIGRAEEAECIWDTEPCLNRPESSLNTQDCLKQRMRIAELASRAGHGAEILNVNAAIFDGQA
ncbi:hypothetical protein G7046_g3307 [Stylonectria norvegica]|nr:hypothetical protein G7046_g3307 [Stylonectria norvegica]